MGHNIEETDVEPYVLSTIVDSNTAKMTVSIDDDDYQFDVWTSNDGDTVSIEYQETLSWRGQIRVAEPRDEVYDVLVKSDEFQSFVEDASTIRRA